MTETQTKYYSYLTSHGRTDTGLCRPNNEDSMLLLPEDGCFFVADGIGGCEAGEIASQTLTDKLNERLQNSAADSPGERFHSANKALMEANKAIRSYAEQKGIPLMGSTIVGFLFSPWRPGHLWLCHVGDSRAYRWSAGRLEQLTEDHSAVRKGEENLPNAKRRLTRAVGINAALEVDWQEVETAPGDFLLLCSDGLTGHISHEELQELFNAPENTPGALTEKLLALALERGGQDNITLIVVGLADKFPPPQEVSEAEQKESAYWANKELSE